METIDSSVIFFFYFKFLADLTYFLLMFRMDLKLCVLTVTERTL